MHENDSGGGEGRGSVFEEVQQNKENCLKRRPGRHSSSLEQAANAMTRGCCVGSCSPSLDRLIGYDCFYQQLDSQPTGVDVLKAWALGVY